MTEQNLAVIEVNDLVPVGYLEREKFFLNENNEVQPLIDAIKNYFSNVIPEGMTADTEEGRKIIKKLAAELNGNIKKVDDIGKSVTDILKAKPKLIDAGRKAIRDALGALYEEIRKPVLEWEAEQARIKAEEQARIAEKQRKDAEELERLRAEKAQRERDDEIAEQAVKQLTQEADAQVKAAQDKADGVIQEAARKERERAAAEKQKSDEEARRLADENHVKAIKNEAFQALIKNGIDRETAIEVIKLISDNKIKNIFIKF